MALKNLLRKFTTPVEVLDEENLREFCSLHPGVQSIASVEARTPTTIVGEIAAVRIVPKADGQWLEATISDGTGKLVALWTGRRRIAGIKAGQRLVLTGRPSASGPGGRFMIYNPIYELL
jgi:hypothetical protein